MSRTSQNYPESYDVEQRGWCKALHLIAKIQLMLEHPTRDDAACVRAAVRHIERFRAGLTSAEIEMYAGELVCAQEEFKQKRDAALTTPPNKDGLPLQLETRSYRE